MKNPLDSLWGTVIAGLVLTVVLYMFAGNFVGGAVSTASGVSAGLFRWVHFMAGVMWIGLLYYFNFVQVAALKDAGADGTAPGITKHVAPRALFFFRWAAVVTWVAGALLLGHDRFVGAFTLQAEVGTIGIGAWLGTIMLFNVWVLIWPNQQKILGMKPASDEEKAKARRVAFLASRTNVMLSMPMLMFMGAGVHGL